MVLPMEAGADDYLLKPFDAQELRARLLAGKRILDLHSELISAQELLRFAAMHDFLTRFWNRAEIVPSSSENLSALYVRRTSRDCFAGRRPLQVHQRLLGAPNWRHRSKGVGPESTISIESL